MRRSRATCLSVALLSLALLLPLAVADLASAQISRLGDSFAVPLIAPASVRFEAIAYDSINNVFLAITGASTIRARFIRPDGTMVGESFRIDSFNGPTAYAQCPNVAFNPSNGTFLVAWSDGRGGGAYPDLYTRVVGFTAGGVPSFLSSDTMVSSVGGFSWWEARPGIAYSTTSRQFLVVWRQLSDAEIHGRTLSDAGVPLSGDLRITQDTFGEDLPAVTYNAATDRFLVGYGGWAATYNFSEVRWVQAGATPGPVGTPMRIINSKDGVWGGDAAYNPVTGKSLFFYASYAAPLGIYAQRFNGDGSFDGAPFAVSSRYFAYDAVSVAYNSVSNTFALATHSNTVEDAVVELHQDGTPVDNGIIATAIGGTGNFNPRIASSQSEAKWLLVTSNQFARMFGQLVQTAAREGGAQTPSFAKSSVVKLVFGATKAGAGGALTSVTPTQTVWVSPTGAGSGSPWTATVNQAWLQLTNASGTGAGQFTASIVNPSNVIGGATSLTATITITPSTAGLAPTTLSVTLTVDQSNGAATSAPFGLVDTPLQNASGVVGAIGMTGWALDDLGVISVKIYRNCLPFEPQNSCTNIGGASVVYLGDASFTEGARSDVESAFANLPLAHRAGWGYLLLTNMLPHVTNQLGYGGHGPLTLYAIATDAGGKMTVLGRTTKDRTPTNITMANDTITKPFGAIDTPQQGQTVSGRLVNFGWALTPDADRVAGTGDILVPISGSTMLVYIDGLVWGSVGYNQCRGNVGNPLQGDVFCNDDVANIFGNAMPQASLTTRMGNPTKFRNLDAGQAAIGAFSFDTSTLSNGLHTIVWGVTDSAGRTDGIGSRYFTVLNTGTAAAARPATDAVAAVQNAPAMLRGDASQVASLRPAVDPVWGRTGFDPTSGYEQVSASEDGVRRVQLAELGRLELQLGAVDGGYLVANGALRDLPPGSQLDPATGQFTWAPGVGYVGTYRLTFVRGDEQIPLDVTIRPTSTPAPGESEIRMYLDFPQSGQAVTGALTVAGWALDPQAAIGSGIGYVHVWAQRRDAPAAPEFLGAATLSGQRPDVAQAHGAQFNRAGFGLTTTALAPGQYDVTTYVWNRRTARWEDARTTAVTVR